MNSKIIGYTAPLGDYSGYGEAARNDVAALQAAGLLVHGEMLRYTADTVNLGRHAETVKQAVNTPPMYDIKIIHTTPDQFGRYAELGKYNIGRLFWETTRLPSQFVEGCNKCDEIWTGSEANKTAAIKSGVTVPIYIIPQAMDTEIERPQPLEIEGFDGHLFYSIFEWTDRKNPEALIAAYLNAFRNGENVGLLLKTYFRDFTFLNKERIRQQIRQLVAENSKLGSPPIFFYGDLLDRQSMWRLHATGDCFVSAHRGEGWGVPQVEAALMGNNVISTNYGGVHEWLPADYCDLLPYNFVRVSGMEHSTKWYTPDQEWADIDIDLLARTMGRHYREAMEGTATINDGKHLRQFVQDTFSFKNVGRLMSERLAEIDKVVDRVNAKGVN